MMTNELVAVSQAGMHETFWVETWPETHVSESETFKILSETRP